MFDLEKLVDDGFSMEDYDGVLQGLALLSLKIALKAYFSTYQAVRHNINIFNRKDFPQEQVDFSYYYSYSEGCSETIVHFQHFAELIIKEILREDHELLSVDASDRPAILYKLLKGEKVDSKDLERLKSLEFSTALKRLCKLIDSKMINPEVYGFIKRNETMLKKLNLLRNRLWHRGKFIIRYPSLDIFIGGYVLPFVEEVMSLKKFSGKEHTWKYKKLDCSLDPIHEIVQELKNGTYNLMKIAYLKELGRAAYNNPLHTQKILEFENKDIINTAEKSVKDRLFFETADIRKCPVCGINSLGIFEETEHDDDPEYGAIAWRFSYEAQCSCCTFLVDYKLDNPSELGLPLEDY